MRARPSLAAARSVRAVALTLLLLAVTAWPAHGATKLETFRETTTQQATFGGAGCAGTSTRTLQLPRGAFNPTSSRPLPGTRLVSASSENVVAQIESVDASPASVTWTARGVEEACDPGMESVAWETEPVELRSTFLIRRRVLTRGTVIRRGDAICRSANRKVARIARRVDRLDETQFDKVIDALRDLARALRGMHRRLSDLAIPKERARSFDGFVRGIDRAQERIDLAADAASEFDERGLKRQFRRMSSALVIAGRHARRYGFRDCVGGVGL